MTTTAKQIIERAISDLDAELPTLNPRLEDSLIRAELIAFSKRIAHLYYAIEKSEEQRFPINAKGDSLTFWARLRRIEPLVAQGSSGLVTIQGVDSTVIDAGTIYKYDDISFKTSEQVIIEDKQLSVSQLTASGTTGVCVTDAEHNLGSGMSVPISGANEAEWNDTFTDIVVTGLNSFTFDIEAGFSSPATGTIVIDATFASVTVEAEQTGTLTNLDNGTKITAETPVAGAEDNAIVQYTGLYGGRDQETEEELQERTDDAYSTPKTAFNPAKLTATIKAVDAENTRVFVHRITPEVGMVTVYFVRDRDDSVIPSAGDVEAAKLAVMAITNAQSDTDNDIIVEAPIGIPIDVTVTNIVPNTPTMKQAVTNKIRAFFRSKNNEGETLLVDAIKSDIYQTYDTDTGEYVRSFDLSSPITDTSIALGEIPIEGNTSVTG